MKKVGLGALMHVLYGNTKSAYTTEPLNRCSWNLVGIKYSWPRTCTIKCTNEQFFVFGKVLKAIYFLKGNNANSNLILLGMEKQSFITVEA